MDAGCVDVTVGDFDIDEVPIACSLVSYFRIETVGVAIFIRPSGAVNEVRRGQVITVSREERVDLLSNRRREAGVGDDADNLVAFIAPGKERRGQNQQ